VVNAREAALAPTGGPHGERKHAVVRADLCVGAGTCVAACPEDGAIRLEGNRAVINLDACVGHGDCVAACPVGAILLTTGAAVQRVQVPLLSAGFETNIPGLHVVGELGGRGLIKNAINEGKIAVEEIVRKRQPAGPRPPSEAEVLDLVVVGAGPAGLSAGLEALRSGLRCVVVEQGSLADTIRKYPRKKILFAEPIKIPLYGELWVSDASKETLLQVWETIIANTGLDVRTGHRVENVVRRGSTFEVHAGGSVFRTRYVVLATGRRGTPRRLGVPGEDGDNVFYDIVEMEAFRGRRVLVVGGGDSAVESALGLCNQEGTRVVLSYRGDAFARIKDRNRAKLDGRVAEKKVHLLLNSRVRAIRRDKVVLEIDGRNRALPNDDVIVRIGGDPPFAFLERIGVRTVQKDVPLPGARAGAGG
jgi:putative YpdA family bacillithiol system oxidoreductase